MNIELMRQIIHNETVTLLSTRDDLFDMSMYVFGEELNNIIQPGEEMIIANIINRDPLASWLISCMMHNIKITPYIRFDKNYMINNIVLYEPYLSKWVESIADSYAAETALYIYEDGLNIFQVLQLFSFPYYIKNNIENINNDLDTREVYNIMFAPLFEALARNDYKTYIDMCLEVKRCLELSMQEHKDLI